MKPEVLIAAKWWADQLREVPAHDNGDALQSGFMRYAAQLMPRPDANQIDTFQKSLAETLVRSRGFGDADWRPNEPMWGRASRAIGTDYSPDLILQEALNSAGIKNGDLLLPIKTMMWINPGKVEVSKGYRAETIMIYPEGDNQ